MKGEKQPWQKALEILKRNYKHSDDPEWMMFIDSPFILVKAVKLCQKLTFVNTIKAWEDYQKNKGRKTLSKSAEDFGIPVHYLLKLDEIITKELKLTEEKFEKKIKNFKQEIIGDSNDTREKLHHVWEKNLSLKIIHAEDYIVPLTQEERATFIADIVFTLGRASQLAVCDYFLKELKPLEGE